MQLYKGLEVANEYEGLIDYFENILDRMAYTPKVWVYQHLEGVLEDVQRHLDLLEKAGVLFKV